MSSFNRELFSATSDVASMVGGAKKRHSKKGEKKSSKKSSKKNMKRSEMMAGAKKSSKKTSKKSSKQSKQSKQSREMPQFMKNMLEVKKDVIAKHTDVKYGPPLIKVISEALKSKGSVDKAVEHINNMSTSELKSILDKIAKDIAEKRASKKASKQERPKQSREMPQFMKDMLEVKKEISAKHTDVKYGPPLIKVISEALKSKGSVDKAVEHINSMSSSELKSKLEKIAKDIAEKRAAKKSA